MPPLTNVNPPRINPTVFGMSICGAGLTSGAGLPSAVISKLGSDRCPAVAAKRCRPCASAPSMRSALGHPEVCCVEYLPLRLAVTVFRLGELRWSRPTRPLNSGLCTPSSFDSSARGDVFAGADGLGDQTYESLARRVRG